MTNDMAKTVERMCAIVRNVGPQSLTYLNIQRLYDRFYDSEIFGKMTVEELAILTAIFFSQLELALRRSDDQSIKIVKN